VRCVRDDVRVALQLEEDDVGNPRYRNRKSCVLAMFAIVLSLTIVAPSSSLGYIVSCHVEVS
jgi:hypothetical protein